MAALRGAQRRRGALCRHRRRAHGGAGAGEPGAAAELAVMGVAEVLPHARRILRRVRETVADIERAASPPRLSPSTAPASPGAWRSGCAQGGEQALPLIHYRGADGLGLARRAAPSEIARWYDQLMVLLPFEPPYFEPRSGSPTPMSAIPWSRAAPIAATGRASAAATASRPSAPLLAVLPGSRRGEVGRLLPIFADAVERLARHHPDLAPRGARDRRRSPTMSAADRGLLAGAARLAGARRGARNTTPSPPATRRSPPRARWRWSWRWRSCRRSIAYRLNPLTHALLRRIVKVRLRQSAST